MKTTLEPKTKTISVNLSEETRDGLGVVAKFQNRSVHYLMKQAVDRFVQQQLEEIAFIQKAEKSAQHLQETGLHLTGEELVKWADEFANNPKTRIPLCHK